MIKAKEKYYNAVVKFEKGGRETNDYIDKLEKEHIKLLDLIMCLYENDIGTEYFWIKEKMERIIESSTGKTMNENIGE